MAIDYNHDHENEITLFAETNFRNQRKRFGIKTDDRRRHIYIIGKTGMGKTTLIENMVLSDIHAGHGVCYVDPHGDTAEKILDYIPSHRINDVVYFNPADVDYPVGFNILETVDDDKKHLVASGLMGVFKKIWPDVWSARMEYILQNCVLALLDYPGATLLGINRLLVDIEYRKRVIAKIRDPIVKTFWVAEFSSWSEKYATEAIAPVQNKVGQFLSASVIRNIVAQVKSTIDPRKVMDEGKILIVNLSKGKIGEDNMRLLGGMIITKLQMAAMERVDIKHEEDRRDFYLYVDEFQNFANQSFANILSEARKYRLNLVVAHQYIKQLEEEVAWAVFGNVGTIVTFRVGAEDAQFMENEFLPTYTIEDLVNLTKFQVYLKLMVDGVATAPFSANTLPPIAQRMDSEEKVIAVSRERYATPRSEIQQKVLKWSGMEGPLDAGTSGISYPDIMTEEERAAREDLGGVPARLKPGTPEYARAGVEALEGTAPTEAREYLTISPERLASIVKTPQGQKKQKPMFKHVCSRCGKEWDMPIQLDPSRPMYCAECLPIIKEEQKSKSHVMRNVLRGGKKDLETAGIKVEDGKMSNDGEQRLHEMYATVEGGKAPAKRQEPNRPRFSQPPRPAPPKGTIRIVTGQDDEDSLLSELVRSKGKPIETDKAKLTGDRPSREEDRGRKRQKRQKDRPPRAEHLPDVPSVSSEEPSSPPKTVSQDPRSVTVFKRATSSVNQATPPPPGRAPFEIELTPPTGVNPLDKRLAHGKLPHASGQTPEPSAHKGPDFLDQT